MLVSLQETEHEYQSTFLRSLRHPLLWREHAYVGGKWRAALGEKTIKVVSPADELPLGEVPDFGERETVQAIEAAENAFYLWRRKPAKERARILNRLFSLMVQYQEDLAMIITAEQGKPLMEARSEVRYAASYVEWFSEEAKRINSELLPPLKPRQQLMVLREPVGVVAAITPWNFPLAMIARKIAPAMAAGCSVIVKPSELTPFSAFALAVLAEEAGVPAGVLNIITGQAPLIAKTLINHRSVRKISFTGSTHIGKLILMQSADSVKKISLELGGNAPLIVCEDADIKIAIQGVLSSKFRNSGQTCICPNRIYVHAAIYDKFVASLVEEVRKLRVGNGFEENITQGPLINEKALRKIERLLKDATDKGATILTGGMRLSGRGYFYAPTVVTNVTSDMALTREEVFGPIVPIQMITSDDEAIYLSNHTPAGLAAYVFSNNYARLIHYIEQLEYGMVGANESAISNEIAPFGGIKESGFGREGGRQGMDEYLEYKYSCIQIPE